MIKKRYLFLLLVIATFVALVIYQVAIVNAYEKAFSATKPGDRISTVLKNFGTPSHVQQSEPFPRYTSEGCVAPCYKRFWWEDPFFKGMQAWSVEVDRNGTVIHTAHWASP